MGRTRTHRTGRVRGHGGALHGDCPDDGPEGDCETSDARRPSHLGGDHRTGAEPASAWLYETGGDTNLWRLRVGQYRVVYAIDDTARTVTVVMAVPRHEVYR